MGELLSNTITLVGVADGAPGAPGTSYYTYIRYSANADGTDFSEKPNIYLGIYTGPSATAPTEKEAYTWTKIEGDPGQTTYIDIRYSNDNLTFTSNKGRDVGDYMGIYVTQDESVKDESYEPSFGNYTWKRITGDPAASYSYKIKYNNKSILRFVSKATKDDIKYSYTPAEFTATIVKSSLAGDEPMTGFTLTAYYTYYDKSGNVHTEVVKNKDGNDIVSEEGTVTITLASNYEDINIQSFSFIATGDEKETASDIIDVVYGLTDDMAKFSLNATNIVQSILDTTLTFDTSGLTIRNGGFIIRDQQDNKVFYADDSGNLFFSGSINTSSGSLGGWIIEPSIIRDSNNKVGLYSGNDAKYKINNALVRFWAGAAFDENATSYKFAVTEDGTLYASDIILSNKLTSNGATISNKLSIGNKDNGITLYGNEEDSFISSAQYASGAAGYGWKISQDGSAEFSNIIARGKIQSSVFEYNKVSSVGGSLYIAPTIYIENHSEIITKDEENNKYILKWISPYTNAQDICGHSWTTEDFVKLNGEILINDIKVTLAGIDAEIIELTTDNTVSFTFTIDISLISDNITNGILQPGGTIILYGTGGKKQGLYLTAADGGSPYMDVYDSDKDSIIMPAVRLGNLSGISDANFPGGKLQGYGLYSSNAYLRGQLMLPGAGITNQDNVTYGDGGANSPIRIWAGAQDIDDIRDANFIVTANGYLYAKHGIFEGTVKATNSEFSGSIKAAGVVIKEGSVGTNPLINANHFFVAYKNTPETFKDYVLDMGEHGLSIWEGALRAYSDFASGENNFSPIYTDDVYGYDSSKPSTIPLPYFTLVDDGTQSELDSRIVAHKAHFSKIKKINTVYSMYSAVIDEGIWFGTTKFSTINANSEKTAFTNIKNQKNIGVGFNNSTLVAKGATISIEAEKSYIGYNQQLIEQTNSDGVHINGQVSINNITYEDGAAVRNGDNIVVLGKPEIKEIIIDDISVGLDFIIK